MDNTVKQRNGRPSKIEQLEIQGKLGPYFEKGISPFVTSKKTGINIKTVNKYFGLWYEEIKNSQNDDFIERCKITKEQAIVTLEEELLQLYEIRNELKRHSEEKQKSKPERWIYKLQLDIANSIVNLVTLKTALANSPTADVTLQKLLAKFSNSTGMENLKHDTFA